MPKYPDDFKFDENNEYINRIAVMNIKKIGGKANSDDNEIRAFALADSKELRSQLKIIDPDIIICGNTFKFLKDILNEDSRLKSNSDWFLYSEILGKKRLVVDYYHPANHYPNKLNYYSITSIYHHALLEKANITNVDKDK